MSSVTTPDKALGTCFCIPISQMRKLRPRKTQHWVQDHTPGYGRAGICTWGLGGQEGRVHSGQEGADTYHTCPRPRRGR